MDLDKENNIPFAFEIFSRRLQNLKNKYNSDKFIDRLESDFKQRLSIQWNDLYPNSPLEMMKKNNSFHSKEIEHFSDINLVSSDRLIHFYVKLTSNIHLLLNNYIDEFLKDIQIESYDDDCITEELAIENVNLFNSYLTELVNLVMEILKSEFHQKEIKDSRNRILYFYRAFYIFPGATISFILYLYLNQIIKSDSDFKYNPQESVRNI